MDFHESFPSFSAQFAVRLMLKIDEADDKNIVLSPARLQAVLVLLANWAKPNIRKLILETAGNDIITQGEANKLCYQAVKELCPEDDVPSEWIPQLEQQTILWCQEGLPVNDKAVKEIAPFFNASVNAIDFAGSNAKGRIDDYVGNASHGLVRKLNFELHRETAALITDILYFKAQWSIPFDSYDTKERMFYGTREKRKVPMMKQTGKMFYYDSPVSQRVRLDFTCLAADGRGYSMWIYLPREKHTVGDVLREKWDDGFRMFGERTEVRLSLPRFDVSADTDTDKIFRKLGLACLFESPDIIPRCVRNLKIEKILQQARVSVDENGTEASALTACISILTGPPSEFSEPVVMNVNRPFLFEIVEDSTNTILFSGVINNL